MSFLKGTQTFKAYQTESYKYCIIIAESNTKISKTHRLLNKMVLSLFALLSAYWDLHFLRLPQQQSFFSSWTQYSANFNHHKWSFVTYIVSFSGLKMVFSKLNLAKYHCLHKKPCLKRLQFTLFSCLQLLQTFFTSLSLS